MLALAACGGPPPPPPPTIAMVKLTVGADANPDADGKGAPVMVRVYQLASVAGFQKAEFFPLLNGDAALLGQDLVKRDDYLLAPGAIKEETLTVPDRVQAIGLFAAYQTFQDKTWRLVIPLPPHQTTPVAVTLGATGIKR